MSVTRSAGWAVAIIAGLQGIANAEFQTFTDEASYRAALSTADSGAPASPAGDTVEPAGDLVAEADHFQGNNLVFTSGLSSFVGFGGWFLGLTGGPISASVDDALVESFVPSTSEFGFWGVVFWQGFKKIEFASSPDDEFFGTNWQPEYDDTAVVPEPASFALFGIGALTLLGCGRRRKKLADPTA